MRRGRAGGRCVAEMVMIIKRLCIAHHAVNGGLVVREWNELELFVILTSAYMRTEIETIEQENARYLLYRLHLRSRRRTFFSLPCLSASMRINSGGIVIIRQPR